MTEGDKSRQARAGETRKRRTREKLIHAADEVLREVGLDAQVQDIARAAGVSTATFYSMYKSRNELCVDAVTELVVLPFGDHVRPLGALPDLTAVKQAIVEYLSTLQSYCEGRTNLIRAGQIGLLEDTELPNFMDMLTDCFARDIQPPNDEYWLMMIVNEIIGWFASIGNIDTEFFAGRIVDTCFR